MTNSRLLKFGAFGTVLATIFCFTPVLVFVFAAVGLSAVIGVLDYVLYPVLAVFVLITVYALVKRRAHG